MAESPPPAEPPTTEQLLNLGFSRLRSHLLNPAEQIFLEVLKSAPANPIALRLLGVTRWKLGQRKAAVAHLRAATVAAPDVEASWNDLTVALRDLGEDQEAEAARQQAVHLRAMQQPDAGGLAPLARMTFSVDRVIHRFTVVDYPYNAAIRYGAGRPPHPELAALIGEGRGRYEAFMQDLAPLHAYFSEIPMRGVNTGPPFWLNSWYPPLDAMALTLMLRRHEPRLFVEIGSGASTKFARRAVAAHGLRTRLVSIDPQPRAEVDRLCDQVIRKPLEQVDPAVFGALAAGDILFLDSSHRAFQNSDVTVFFLEILPRLKPGVLVHIHDIYLPDDYISGHVFRQWNEQYLLAVALLFGDKSFEILFPAWFVGQDPALRAQAQAQVFHGPLAGLDPYGAAFWMRKV
ncbi:class I SAM-dependent methyltransferase [uncultured Phenylobacterium sp.]|uniref:class I SAM-dependent methyltransferase n=1 Tax=uncultured Phenylobacterium sp. TaxID=349273 RepID=UPI0025DC71CD|nr:class I SAM-dependent methyltransferase [uncultured Phenylobacterium sp.]